jgi:hypothetical protein
MGNHKGKLESLRAPIEERESTELLGVGLSSWGKKRAIVRVRERYKYLSDPQ